MQTCRGSHTHTLVSSPADKENLYVYGSGTGAVRSGDELKDCSGKDPKEDPNTALFNIVDRKLQFAGYYKLPAAQTEQENCVAHNGSLIPVPGRDIMVQAWYQGGISIFDFTDAAKPVEIAYFDRGPLDDKQLITGGFWSAYWYNGRIYGAEIARGIDVFKLKPSEFLTQNEIDAALAVQTSEFNAQEQPKVVWPATPVVARAYLDQLGRTSAIQAARATAVRSALDKAAGVKSSKDKHAAETAGELDKLAGELTADAGSASGRDAVRLKALADNLREQGAKMR